METVKSFIIGTPWYVYLIIVYMIWVGIKAVKGGNVHIKKLIVLPIVFLYLSLETLLQHGNISSGDMIMWLIGLSLGIYVLGWLPYRKLGVSTDPATHTITVPGSYFTLSLIVMTFIVKYTCAALIAMQYNFSDFSWSGLLCISGLFTGAFIGRFIYAAYHLYIRPWAQSGTEIK